MQAAHKEYLEKIGGEPLEGSGFESEKPDPGFSEPSPAVEESRR